ncbi:MAG: molybdopterin oxidoreductase, partial [Myxococcota bacterium]
MAFAGATASAGCRRWEKEEIITLDERPEDYIPGVTRSFATALEIGGVATSLVVNSYDGRPIKVEGNPDHPFLAAPLANGVRVNGNGTGGFAQASILSLYDPDRSGQVRQAEGAGTWESFAEAVKGGLQPGPGMRVLSEATSSPTVTRLREQLKRRGVRWHSWEPLTGDTELVGIKLAYGRQLRPLARLDRARIIVAIDGDLFHDHPAALRYTRDFAAVRDPDSEQPMARLYTIESPFSAVGAKADHRLAAPSSEIGGLVAQLEAALSGRAPEAPGRTGKFIAELAKDLNANRGGSVLVVGQRQPPAVHAAVARINSKLGALGSTLEYLSPPDGDERLSHLEDIRSLAADMKAGKVETLLILGGNPAYDAPAEVAFAEALKAVPYSIRLGVYDDETSRLCAWSLPETHPLEQWGDAIGWDGSLGVSQPMIEPL